MAASPLQFNPSNLKIIEIIYKFSPYLTGNTLFLRYKDQPVNAV
jgi:hypothetical protein